MDVQEATTRRLPDLKERHLPENCREAVNTILKETYGYEQFRNLEIYDDLFKGKEKLCISQGQLIENVILEAEEAWKGIFHPIGSFLPKAFLRGHLPSYQRKTNNETPDN